MPRINTKSAESLAIEILRRHGTPDDIAADVAAHLVLAERSGHASHGLSILPGYLEAARAGLLAVAARPAPLVAEGAGAIIAFDGQCGFGQHAGKVAVSAAIEQASNAGTCFMTLKNSYHLGRAGHYGEMAAHAGLAFLSFINVVGRPPTVAPFGGTQARMSTNPLCFAMPMGPGRAPFLLDYATSGIAANKVRLMAAGGQPVPEGMLIDSEGKPTVDAAALLGPPAGSLLPFGGHKGYALGFIAEMLAGVLSGGGTIAPGHERDGGLRNNLFAVLFDPARFGDIAWEHAESAAFADYVTSSTPMAARQSVMVPGQPEANAQAAGSEHMDMTDAAWALFAGCARAALLVPEEALTSE